MIFDTPQTDKCVALLVIGKMSEDEKFQILQIHAEHMERLLNVANDSLTRLNKAIFETIT